MNYPKDGFWWLQPLELRTLRASLARPFSPFRSAYYAPPISEASVKTLVNFLYLYEVSYHLQYAVTRLQTLPTKHTQ